MLIHFQIQGEREWEALGSGESTDGDPLPGAIEDLRSLYGGKLPAGRYRFVEAHGTDARFGTFELLHDGELLD
jgi:hypothetical protein